MHVESVNLGTESLAHLSRCAAEDNHVLAARNRVNREAFRLKPVCDCCNLFVRQTKRLSELFGRQPLMEIWRRGIVQTIDERFERLLPRSVSLENKNQVLHRKVVGHRSLVELRAC